MATNTKVVVSVLFVGLVVGAAVTAVLGQGQHSPVAADQPGEPAVEDGLRSFESALEYREYVQRGRDAYAVSRMSASGGGDGAGNGQGADQVDRAEQSTDGSAPTGSDDRIGGTNVQEQGIDEPDLVATVGQHFVYAPGGDVPFRIQREQIEHDPAPDIDRSAHVIDTANPASPELVAEIDASGKMVRSGDSLVVLASNEVIGYDVSDPENPTQTWSKELNSPISTARMNDGQLYVVTRTSAHESCPIRPMGTTDIACTDIQRPAVQINADATFTAYSIDPDQGDVTDSTSFVGTARSTVVYMSADSLYVTYTEHTDRAELMTDYLIEDAEGVPADVKERLREIDSYDISATSKQREMQRAIEGWMESLSETERRVTSETISMGLEDYVKEQQRTLTETGIVRIGVGDGDLSVDATGSVAGEPLNQFSMDEHEGTLRIATTIPQVYGAESENDLYTLDATTLDQLGAETGMGVDERIYSVRYVGDTAYMVTFRQIDPFHVVDLSDPRNPEELGNVELPGFSDYLHPVGPDTIMGIGQEDGQVKAVLFDVSDPANPTVADSKIIDAHWSAVSSTHHAFMQDPRHGVAFLPTGEQGVVLDYTNQTLSIEKKVTLDAPPERARYVGDYLYVFSPAEIQVLDETTWEVEGTLSLGP